MVVASSTFPFDLLRLVFLMAYSTTWERKISVPPGVAWDFPGIGKDAYGVNTRHELRAFTGDIWFLFPSQTYFSSLSDTVGVWLATA